MHTLFCSYNFKISKYGLKGLTILHAIRKKASGTLKIVVKDNSDIWLISYNHY